MNPSITNPLHPRIRPPAGGAVAAPAAAAAGALLVDHEVNNPLRIYSLYLGLALVFLRVSTFHQVQSVLMHVNLRSLYVVGIPAVMGTILCGGIPRSFRKSPTLYWTAFFVWMTLACTTSFWPGGSVRKTVIPYLRTNLIMVFVVAGLIVSWKECRSFLKCLAVSAVGSLLVARVFSSSRLGERFSLEFGTVSNPNDFAAHLLFCLPFLYWVVLSSKSAALRLISIAGLAYGVIVIVKTGSRGGLVAIAAVVLAMLLWGSMKHRLVIAGLIPIVFLTAIAVVPHQTLVRIMSFSAASEGEEVSNEALESTEQRKYLLKKSIEYTLKYPLFGVGPGQFANYEGRNSQVIGSHGTWHETHNTLTEVSSECGIPGLLFYLAGLLVPLKIFYATFKRARKTPGCEDIRDAMLCSMLSLIGFNVAVTFLNFAYFFYQPLLGGWGVVVGTVIEREFENRGRAPQPAAVQPPVGLGTRVLQPAPRPV